MYEFAVTASTGSCERMWASSWSTALHIAETEYGQGSIVTLATPATGVTAVYDLLRGLLVVRYGDSTPAPVVDFLRRELRYRRRNGVYGVSVQWSPSEEDMLAQWLNVFPTIDLANVVGELPEPGTLEYWRTLATADLLNGGPISPATLFTRLRALKKSRHVWVTRLSKDQEPEHVTVLRWIEFLDLQIAYLQALYDAQEGDVHLRLKGLHRGYEILVDGKWRRVWRVNEQSVRCEGNSPEGLLVYPEQIQGRRRVDQHGAQPDSLGVVLYRGGWLPLGKRNEPAPQEVWPDKPPTVADLREVINLVGVFAKEKVA